MITYNELLQSKKNEIITYQDMLFTIEWISKRNSILERDARRCTNCNYCATGSYAHFDEKTNKYTYLTDNGSEQIHHIVKSDGTLESQYIPNLIVTDKPYHLQVHHKYYILNRLPWNYDDNVLITLCNWCHTNLHENEVIQVYENENFVNALNLIPCDRCSGLGWFEEHKNINNGTCFKCHGQRFTSPLINLYEINENEAGKNNRI